MGKYFFAAVPYVKYLLFIWIAIGGCYDLYFDGFGEYVDRLYFIIGYFIFCAVFQFIMSKNKMLEKSKWGNVFVNGVIIEMYFVTLFAQEHFTAAVIILLLLAAGHVFLYRLIVSVNSDSADNVKVRRCIREKAQHIACCLAGIVLLVPSGIGFYEEYIEVTLTPEEWVLFVEIFNEISEENQEETLFEKHEETLLELNEWSSLDNDSKVELIYKIGIIELEHLGISDEVGIKIQADKIDEYTLGYYLDSQKQIVINIGHICSDDVEENINTISHEVFHAYQHYVVSTVDFESDFVQNSYYYADARAWKDNIENYISAETDFDGYQSQPLEADASEYAEQRVNEYLVAIS